MSGVAQSPNVTPYTIQGVSPLPSPLALIIFHLMPTALMSLAQSMEM